MLKTIIMPNLNHLIRKSKMTFKLSERSQERLKGVDNRIFNIVELALTISHIDFGIPKYGGLRTAADQRNLFTSGNGVTKCDGIEIKSEHQSGLAFDIYAYVDYLFARTHFSATKIFWTLIRFVGFGNVIRQTGKVFWGCGGKGNLGFSILK